MMRLGRDRAGEFYMSKSEAELFSLNKVRSDGKCWRCQKDIKKGYYCFGKRYTKYCIDCIEFVIDNAIKGLKSEISSLRKIKRSAKYNKDYMVRQNLASSLG